MSWPDPAIGTGRGDSAPARGAEHRAPRSAGREPIRVLVVDDEALFRRGIRKLIDHEEGMCVVGEAAGADDAVQVALARTADVALMDLPLRGRPGIEATRRLLAGAPHLRVVVLTESTDEAEIVEALVGGACGYLGREATPDAIAAAIRAAAAGESLLPPPVVGMLLERVRRVESGLPPDVGMPLSDRELEVLRLIAAGRDNGEIAALLVISSSTVKNHISRILTKLQVENRIQAAVYAVRKGLV